ncbi:hypothetical protein ACVWZA_000712 [Sphingomonas sp. UYAg733]
MTEQLQLQPLTGRCLCGELSYKALGRLDRCYVCHCTDCQKRSGSSFIVTLPVAAETFELSGDTITVEPKRGDAPPAVVHFCPSCLCRIFTVSPARPGFVMLRGGSLDDTTGLDPAVHIWTSSKQSWVELPEGVPALANQPTDAAEWLALLR